MLTDTQADIAYEKALDALDLVIVDDAIGAKDRAAAERKRKRLMLVYIGKAIEDIEARTAKFQAFIGEMQELIDKFDPATTLASIAKLQGVIQEASKLVEVATEGLAAVPKAVAARGGARASARKRATVTAKRGSASTAGRAGQTPPARKRAGPPQPTKRAAVKRPAAKRRPAAPTRAGKPKAARP